MQDCCRFWLDRKLWIKQNFPTPGDGASPYVKRMLMVNGCPECLTRFRKKAKRYERLLQVLAGSTL